MNAMSFRRPWQGFVCALRPAIRSNRRLRVGTYKGTSRSHHKYNELFTENSGLMAWNAPTWREEEPSVCKIFIIINLMVGVRQSGSSRGHAFDSLPNFHSDLAPFESDAPHLTKGDSLPNSQILERGRSRNRGRPPPNRTEIAPLIPTQ